jgi:MFS family permease
VYDANRRIHRMLQSTSPSIETRTSWVVATMALMIQAFTFGAPWITVVALKSIAAEAGDLRSVPALASSLAWFGSAVGGIVMGRVAERYGVRWTVMFGVVMIAIGLAFSTLGPLWQLQVGHGLFIGLLGLSGINAPLYVYVSKWFDRRRGSALALIASGSYIAGACWPPLFERALAYWGWRETMLWYGALAVLVVVPLALAFLRNPPQPPLHAQAPAHAEHQAGRVLGWPRNLVFGLIAAASFMCCVTMSMPQSHLVSFCTDLGINASHGAAMLSLLLGTAFVSRQAWGFISDRIGGLTTVLASSAAQIVTMSGFLLTQDEVGLFAVSAAFGLGFAGLIPAYVLAVRELFPVSEASWRIPTLLLFAGSGMAVGGWLAGLLYDTFGNYVPAFTTGIAFNLANFAIVALLVARYRNRFATT